MIKVNVGVPVSRMQDRGWWARLWSHTLYWQEQGIRIQPMVGGAAMPDQAKNIIVEGIPGIRMNGKNDTLTHENRNAIAKENDESDAEWLFFIDDDTVPPREALPRLLALEKKFVGGVYYHRDDRALPLIYNRAPNGMYAPIVSFERGALMPVDAMGLGCALIHRDVFVAIRENYRQMRRKRGSFFIFHKDDFRKAKLPGFFQDQPTIYDNGREMFLIEPVHDMEGEFDDRPFMYFDMESGRTEDIGFCERAQRCGFEIWADTSIECSHLGVEDHDGSRFRTSRNRALITGTKFEERA